MLFTWESYLIATSLQVASIIRLQAYHSPLQANLHLIPPISISLPVLPPPVLLPCLERLPATPSSTHIQEPLAQPRPLRLRLRPG